MIRILDHACLSKVVHHSNIFKNNVWATNANNRFYFLGGQMKQCNAIRTSNIDNTKDDTVDI